MPHRCPLCELNGGHLAADGRDYWHDVFDQDAETVERADLEAYCDWQIKRVVERMSGGG